MLSKFADYKPKLRNPGRRQVPTFQTVTDRWWESKSRELAPGSLKSYVPCVARAVDVFGGYRMNEITGGDIAALLNDMKAADFSAKVISNQHSVLNQIFDAWCEEYGGEINVSRTVKNPRKGRRQRRTRPAETQRALLDGLVSDHDGGLFLGFLLYTSCRRGEALALQWQDIDLDKGRISITKSVTYMGNAPFVGPTKTEAGVRTNPVLDPFRPYLESAARRRHRSTDYIFGGAEPLTSSRFRALWLNLLEPAGLTTVTDGGAWKGNRKSQRRALVTPHQLRHEYAYTLYRAGVPALAAKTLMGHSDIRVTENIYTELGQRDMDDAAALLNKHFTASRESPETHMDKTHVSP